MDLTALAIDGEDTPVTLRRRGAGAYDEGGDFIPGAQTDTVINAALQPVTSGSTGGSQLEDLPEGIRTEARSLLWTRTALQDGDLVVHGSKVYRVIWLWDRMSDGGFCKAALGLTQ